MNTNHAKPSPSKGPSSIGGDKSTAEGAALAVRLRATADNFRLKAHLMSMEAKTRWSEEFVPSVEAAIKDLEGSRAGVSETLRASASELADAVGAFSASLETSSERLTKNTMSAEKLKGLSVLTSEAKNIGKIVEVAVNPTNWSVRNLGVKLTKEAAADLGIEKQLWGSHVLRIPTVEISAVGDESVICHLSWAAIKKEH